MLRLAGASATVMAVTAEVQSAAKAAVGSVAATVQQVKQEFAGYLCYFSPFCVMPISQSPPKTNRRSSPVCKSKGAFILT